MDKINNDANDPPCHGKFTVDDMNLFYKAVLKHLNETEGPGSSSQSSSSAISSYDVSFALILVVSSVVILVNIGSLIAILHAKKINAYIRLVISLSISDILVAIRVLVGSLDINPFSKSDKEVCVFINLRGIRTTLHLVSLFNLLGLGLDHYGAILQPLHYRYKMSAARTNILIVGFWVVSALCGFSDFFIPAASYSNCYKHNDTICADDSLHDLMENTNMSDYVLGIGDNDSMDNDYLDLYNDIFSLASMNTSSAKSAYDHEKHGYNQSPEPTEDGFCYSVLCSRYDAEYLVFSIAAMLLLVMTFIYTRVCIKIYSMRHLLRGRSRHTFRKNKKGLITTMCIVGTFMICWLPFCFFNSVTLIRMILYPDDVMNYYKIAVKVDQYLYALLLLNSLCDPIIYALRMREVKIGYFRLLGRCSNKYRAQGLNGSRSLKGDSTSSYQLPSRSRCANE